MSGFNQVNLNFQIDVGENYKIGIIGNNEGLYRNSSVVDNVFPINLVNIIDITGNTTENPLNYFYYFYNWQLEIGCNNLLGCTNESACNYDESANEDDGSCIFAEMYLDCLGNCINDTDQDQVCDEEDNCIDVINPVQTDSDDDGEGDACDYDDDIGIDEITEDTPTLIKIIDVLGREQQEHNKGSLLFYIYDNGVVEKKLLH